MDFKPFHQHMRLSYVGKVEPLVCPDDGERLGVMCADPYAEELEPMLHCFACGSNIRPGLDLFQKVVKAIESV